MGHRGQRVDEVREHEHQIDHRQAAEVADGVKVFRAPVDLAGKGAATDADGWRFARGQVQAAQLHIDGQHHLDLVDRLDKAQAAVGAFLHLAAQLEKQVAGLALDIAQAGGQRAERGGDIDVVDTGFGQHTEALEVKTGAGASRAPAQGQVKGGVDLDPDGGLDGTID